jgi:tRNA-modifying protein YgfZ
MDSPLLHTPGAVPGDPPDSGVAVHYGDPFREQRALIAGSALVDRGNRGVVRITGPDRLTWLHSLTSQHLTDLRPHTPTQALLLSPKGHVEHHLRLVDDGASVWAHVEPDTAAELVAFLDKMRFMLRVEVTDETARYAVVTLGVPAADPPRDTIAMGDMGPAGAVEGVGTDLLLPRARLAGIGDELGMGLAGLWAHEALRIAAHQPRFGFDTDHRVIPHEVGWIDAAVHLDKGCYRGQETVARVHNLGRPPRRLVFLHLDGSVDRLPGHGDAVELDGRQVGFVGSAARHYELGPIALALVKRNVPTDARLLAGGVAAAQEIVVSPDTGANVKIALRRSR